LHAERCVDVSRVKRATAEQIIADFKRRDALGGIPDECEVRDLIDLRGRLLAAIDARDATGRVLTALQKEYREALRSEPNDPAKLTDLTERGEQALGLQRRAAHDVLVLEREFEERTTASGCAPALYNKHLEEDLARAQSGKRREEPLIWDFSQQICRHFVSHITAKGIEKERVRLDDPDDALAYTLVLRALLSADQKEDLLTSAIREQEDDWLASRRPPESWMNGRALHEFVALTLRTRRGEYGHDQLPLPPEVLQEQVIEAKDERLRWFLLAAEQALEAATGELIPESVGMESRPDATDSPHPVAEHALPSASPPPRSTDGHLGQPTRDAAVLRRLLKARNRSQMAILRALSQPEVEWMGIQAIADGSGYGRRAIEVAGAKLRDLKPDALIATDLKNGYCLTRLGRDVARLLES
jgi:hypothetical protein